MKQQINIPRWVLVTSVVYFLICLTFLFLGLLLEFCYSDNAFSFVLVLGIGAINIAGVKTISILYTPHGGTFSSALFFMGSIFITSIYLLLTLYFINLLHKAFRSVVQRISDKAQ